ncbi:MAG: prepilin-type N-terminal cleavage/methylation domain-containing protein [Sulfurimonas sp.]|nr:prepilin-type N-terminal cleavage/methylation domain-containing protein [Sulfurimonas sp.]
MKRAGFTMIELIFVIVILGILAAVAIPKLAATRTDAEVSKGASDVATLVSDLGAYYTSQGAFDFNAGGPSNMTNVPVDSTNLTDGTLFNYEVPTGTACVGIKISDTNGSVSITDASGTGSAACEAIITVITNNGILKTHNFGGTGVQY